MFFFFGWAGGGGGVLGLCGVVVGLLGLWALTCMFVGALFWRIPCLGRCRFRLVDMSCSTLNPSGFRVGMFPLLLAVIPSKNC